MTQKDEQTDKLNGKTNLDQWINGHFSRLYDKKSTGDLKVKIRFGEYMTWDVSHLLRFLSGVEHCEKFKFVSEIICICASDPVFVRRSICICVWDYLYL